MIAWIASANRDKSQFVSLTTSPASHGTWQLGPGNSLLPCALLRGWKDKPRSIRCCVYCGYLQLAVDPTRLLRSGSVLRGLKALPVSFTTKAPMAAQTELTNALGASF